LLPIVAVACALSVSTASAQVRDHNALPDQCNALHVVVVKGMVTAAATTGATSFSANVRIIREDRFDPGLWGYAVNRCSGPTINSLGGMSTGASPSRTSNATLTIDTNASTMFRMDGSASSVGDLAVGDHIVVAFIVPRFHPLTANADLTAAWIGDFGASDTTAVGPVGTHS